jgi:hypothetical protein
MSEACRCGVGHGSENGQGRLRQAAFFPRLTLAHLARWAAAILRRAEADIVRRFLGASAMPFAFAPKVRSEQAFSSRK